MGQNCRHEEHDRDRGRDRADQDPPGEHAATKEQVADCPAGKNADHAADADDEQHERPQRLVDRILTRDELDTEGLHAREKEVPSSAGDDQDDIRPDAQDVARRSNETSRPGSPASTSSGSGSTPRSRARRCASVSCSDSSLHADGLLRRVRVGERSHATARRLRQAKDQPRQRESGQRKQDERRTPRQRRDVAGDGKAETCACQLSRRMYP